MVLIARALALLTLILIPCAALAQDTTVVRSSGPPAWGTEVHLVEELRIGALDGPEEETFGSIVGVAILPDGNVLRIERDHEPVEVGSQEHRQWEAYRSHFETMVPATLGEEPQFDPVPRVKPPFRAIRVDEDGRIWVHRHVEAVHHPASSETREARGDRPILEWREPVVHDVFDRDGTYLAEITLPPRTAFQTAKGRHIWVRLSGEFGEAYIVRFRVEASS